MFLVESLKTPPCESIALEWLDTLLSKSKFLLQTERENNCGLNA
jgi:hypothetical protein